MERAVRVTPRGLDLGREEIPLVSGSIHYWRHDRKLWDHLLSECREMGFQILCTYVPWSIHELEKGKFDFGEKIPGKDLGAFLDLAHSKGLKFIVRAGPHINSELTYFGYPKRILLDPKNQARSAGGTSVVLPIPPRMFPVPSHFSKNFQDETQIFLEALAPVIRPRLHPKGPIVLLQIDNEWSFFFRYSAYEQDYSEGALSEYRAFLKDRYGNISTLNDTYGTDHASFAEVVPPKRFGAKKLSEWPPYLDWMEAREKMHRRGLSLIKERYERVGLAGVATSHNFPVPFPQSPLDVSACEEVVDIQGTDHYPKKTDYSSLKKEGCLLAGSSRLPFIPEFSSGFFPVPGYPILLEDERFTTLALFMHGLKAINFYMLVERERWAGSPLTRDGRRREELFEFYKRLNEVLARTQLHRLRKRRECVLLTNPDALRITRAASVLPITDIVVDVGALDGEMLVDERDLGFGDKIQIEYGRTFESLFRALSRAHIPFDIANPETLPGERLSQYRAAILPSFDVLGRAAQQKLRRYIENGGHLILGPRLPSLDEGLKPCGLLGEIAEPSNARKDRLALGSGFEVRKADLFDGKTICRKAHGKGALVQFGFCFPKPPQSGIAPEAASWAAALLAEGGIHPSCPSADPVVETALHEAEGLPRVLFVANPEKDIRKTRIQLAPGLSSNWIDAWDKSRHEAEGETLLIDIPPHTVRILMEESQ